MFAPLIKEIYPNGPDVILELVGGDYLMEDIDCVAQKGRIIVVGLLAGRTVSIDLTRVLTKRLTIKGTMLRARPLAEKILANQILAKHLAPLFRTGNLKPVIEQTFSLKDAAHAIKHLDNGKVFGKIILTCD